MGPSEWIRARDLAGAGARLFCLPHAGSGSAGFYRWRRLMKSVNVCPVHLPGRDLRRDEAPRSDGEALAAALHEATQEYLHQPYAIFGHSMGALLAFRWAQLIQDAALPAPRALILSARAPRRRAGVSVAAWLGADDDTLLQSLDERFGGNAATALQDAELRAAFLPVLRADLQVVESLRTDGAAVAANVLAVCGDADPSVSAEDMQRWQPFAATSFQVKAFAGGHFYHFGKGEPALLQEIGASLVR